MTEILVQDSGPVGDIRCATGGGAPGLARAQECRGGDPALAVQGRLDRLRRPRAPRPAPTPICAARRVDGRRRASSPRCCRTTPPTTRRSSRICATGPTAASGCRTSSTPCWPSSRPPSRADGLQHLVVFPMYTQNGNPDRNLEAVVLRMVWPEWLAELERTRYDNPLFCGITFEDFTAGLRHQLRRALPGDHRRARGPRALHLGRHLLRPRGRPLPPGHRGRRRHPRPRAARGHRRDGRATRSAASRPSCCGTWSTTAPTATATCRSTPS